MNAAMIINGVNWTKIDNGEYALIVRGATLKLILGFYGSWHNNQNSFQSPRVEEAASAALTSVEHLDLVDLALDVKDK